MHPPLLMPLVTLALALLSGAVLDSVTGAILELSDGGPLLSPYNVHEKRTQLPTGWRLTRRLDGNFTIPLRFALKQRNIEHIETYLHDVSHPKSPMYGKHWTAGDVAHEFAPTDETVDTVRNWLVASGIGEDRIALGRTRGWIQVDVTVEEAEQLIHTEYNVYTHASEKEHVACEVYHLPEHVQRHVDFVIPSVHFDAKLTRRSGDERTAPARNVGQPGTLVDSLKTADTVSDFIDELSHCDERITPICLRMLYYLFYEPFAADRNSYGVVEYTPQAYLQSDLQVFAEKYSTDLIGKEPYFVSIDGGTNQSFGYNDQPNLELQYGMSLVTGEQTVTLYQTGDDIESASFNNFLDAIDGSYCTFDGGDNPRLDSIYPDSAPGGYKGLAACGTVKPAYVISTSYGYNEHELTPSYAERQCAEYAKLGLMGVTVLYGSGDDGVAGIGQSCLNPNGKESYNGTIFEPTFPCTCQFITCVGATMVKPNATVFDPEMACMDVIYSSGGFSNYFTMPDYQKDAVTNYLTHYPPDYPSKIWNSTGTSRGYPDISANGAKYVVANDGEFSLLWGTSASATVIGAMFTMINDVRLAFSKGPIGFANPAIYSPEFACGFHDITEGSNPGCGTNGYNATIGWDAVTGVGTPNFIELLQLWLSLP